MKITFYIKYEDARTLHAKALLLATHWTLIVNTINKIGNKECVARTGQTNEISASFDGEAPFVLRYETEPRPWKYFFTIEIGDAKYFLTVDPAQVDHQFDELVVQGSDSLLSVGENAYRVVGHV